MTADALQLRDVSVRLGQHRALDEVGFTLPEGSFCAIIGPNGGGKTTLLKVLLGLMEAKGEIGVFGHAPGDGDPGEIGYVPQVKTLDRTFPARAVELVVAGLRASWPMRIRAAERERAMEAMSRVGAGHLAARPISRLSGGELQRIYLAESIVRRPRMILLDEPATGLDVSGEMDMLHFLDEYRGETGCTVLMITHDWSAAYHHASHVLVLDRRVMGFGPPRDTLNDETLRKAFGHIGHDHLMAFAGGAGHA